MPILVYFLMKIYCASYISINGNILQSSIFKIVLAQDRPTPNADNNTTFFSKSFEYWVTIVNGIEAELVLPNSLNEYLNLAIE